VKKLKECNYEELIRKVAYKKALPINGYPALYIPDLNSTVICDIHLGYEEEVSREGIILPKVQTERVKNRIERMNELVSTKRLIINGDIRHGFEKITKREYREIENFLLFISSFYKEVLLVKGNHDTFIRPIARKLGFPFVDYLNEREYLIMHGHEDNEELIKKSEVVIIGHEHPAIKMISEEGEYKKYLAIFYVPTKSKNIFVMVPPFSIFASGTALNERSNSLAGIAKKYSIVEEGIPFIIDERLGTIELPKLRLLYYFKKINTMKS